MDLIKRNEFLPEGYKVPDKSKQFLKLTPGENQIRFISVPILGYVAFNNDNKPVRRPYHEGEFTRDELQKINAKKDENGNFEPSRHFWIALVWSYEFNAPKILEITQASVYKTLTKITEDPDWGDLRNFNINIERTGTGKHDTSFTVTPKPPKELTPEILEVINEMCEKKLLDLNAIWEGNYPFEIYDYE